MCTILLKEILLCMLSMSYVPFVGDGRVWKGPECTLVIRTLSCSVFTSLRLAWRKCSPQFLLPFVRKSVTSYIAISSLFYPPSFLTDREHSQRETAAAKFAELVMRGFPGSCGFLWGMGIFQFSHCSSWLIQPLAHQFNPKTHSLIQTSSAIWIDKWNVEFRMWFSL